MSYNRKPDLREALIHAGIEEINVYGANGLSLRRVATACQVSTAAPYKHYKDKKEFIAAIIDYVNNQWATEQDRILAASGTDPRSRMVDVAVGYVKFLMENPHYRQILMLKNADFDNLYHRKPGEINSRTQQIMMDVKEAYGLSDEVWERKCLMVRSLLFGSVFLIDCGEFVYNERTLENVRYLINREFQVE